MVNFESIIGNYKYSAHAKHKAFSLILSVPNADKNGLLQSYA